MKVKFLMGLLLVSVFMLSACSGTTGNSENEVKLDSLFLEKSHEAVKEAYGDDYIPSMAYELDQLKDIFGITVENVDAFIAEGPMMSVHVDTFIAIRAKEGKGETIAAELEAYREKLIQDSLQYPMNMAKVNASTVYVVDDHVYFLMLGKINENGNQTEDEALEYEKDQVKKAVDAIEELLK